LFASTPWNKFETVATRGELLSGEASLPNGSWPVGIGSLLMSYEVLEKIRRIPAAHLLLVWVGPIEFQNCCLCICQGDNWVGQRVRLLVPSCLEKSFDYFGFT
jgi:hypothetical protein